jgi:alkaline phosphatase
LRHDQPPGERAEPVRHDTQGVSLLDANSRHGKGFFLQVEGASIDKQDHAANACGQIGENVAFDDAIGVALEYQRSHPDTLIVVTADHAHTSQIVGEDSNGANAPTGYSDNLITKDGQTLRLTYGTAGGPSPAAAPPSQQHTGSVVPIWGGGPGAAEILGTTDHTDLFDVLGPDSGHHGW